VTDKRDELVSAMDELLTGATYGDALEALLDITAALVINGAPDRDAADRTTACVAEALSERVDRAWQPVRGSPPVSGRLQ
jgi:hypothetical protein